jgi:hypothetical protein
MATLQCTYCNGEVRTEMEECNYHAVLCFNSDTFNSLNLTFTTCRSHNGSTIPSVVVIKHLIQNQKL